MRKSGVVGKNVGKLEEGKSYRLIGLIVRSFRARHELSIRWKKFRN